MKTEIIVAIIAAIATFITVIGSILAVKITSNLQIKEQRIISDRKMKRQYYASFIDALNKHLMYMNQPDCKEKIETGQEFFFESNKLPMYASEEMVSFIEKIKKNQIVEEEMKNFLVILRKDLCDDSFKPFSDVKEINLVIPKRVCISTYK